LQLTEGAYSDHHPSIPAPKNPWHPDYWSGISSSGPGAALAAGLCYGALGSDTGGSIRWPSAANGITGLKPTWGRVSRHGVFPLAPTLDHVGTMARSAVDAGVLLSVIAGEDPMDPTALRVPAPTCGDASELGIAGLRMGVDPRLIEHDVDGEVRDVVRAAAQCFAELDIELVEVTLPDCSQAIADWASICAVEAAVAHESVYPANAEQYGPVLAQVMEAGRALSGLEYQKLILRRLDFCGRVEAVINRVDLLLVPAQPFAPLTLDAVRTLGEQPALIAKLQRFTCPFNLTGSPTITLAGGFTNTGMPIAFQLVANHLQEGLLVRAAAAYQSVTSWHARHPVLP
jgi:amidase